MNTQLLLISKDDLESTIETSLSRFLEKINVDTKTKSNRIRTLDEAAEYCRMPVPTFRQYVSKKAVVGSKIGKPWKFYEEDLDDFIRRYRNDLNAENKQDQFKIKTRQKA